MLFLGKKDTLKSQILAELAKIIDPASGKSLTESGKLSPVIVKEGKALLSLEISPDQVNEYEPLCRKWEARIANISGITSARLVLTTTNPQPPQQTSPQQESQPEVKGIPNVKRIILIASGKGGVGKSTVTVKLAEAFAQQGNKTAIIDADVYGPSISRMMGLEGKPESQDDKLLPITRHSIACMSMGNLVERNSAIAWRGPMVGKALYQMLHGVEWGERDIMLIDTPPGTGDVHLSLAKAVKIDGVVMVTTPQQVATEDTARALDLFRKLNIPILGIIENMSHLKDSSGQLLYPFGKNGGKKLAEKENVAFLGEIPMQPTLCEELDNGLSDSQPLKECEAIAMKLKEPQT